MSIQVNIGEAKTRLSELLAKVDEGEALIIARGNVPMYEVRLIDHDRAVAREAVTRLKAMRAKNKPVTREEIRDWIDEGRA
ncbi:MAG: type II toxin-antitoxin system prevent-host-death family antitoxin [Pseudomonadota bacterium]